MPTAVGSLYTSLTLDSASFVSNMKRAATVTEETGAKIQKALNVAKAAAVGFVGLEIVGALGEAAKRATEYASSLGETSEQLGFTSKGLQELRYAATQSGASIESTDKALGKFSVNVGKAREGNKQLRDAFASVGIGAKDLANLDTEQLLSKVADGLAAIPDPARRAAVEVAVLGKGGQALAVVLNSGSAGIRAFADEAGRAGIVVSDKAITALDNLNDSADRLKLVVDAHLAQLIGDNADAILSLGKAAAAAIGGLDALLNRLRGVKAIGDFNGGGLKGLLADIKGNGKGLLGLDDGTSDALAGTSGGLAKYGATKVAEQEQLIARYKKLGVNEQVIAAAQVELVRRRRLTEKAAGSDRDDALAGNRAGSGLFASITRPKSIFAVDDIKGSEETEARKAEAAQRKAEEEAARLAARVQQIKGEIASAEAGIARTAIALAATPESRLSLEIAAAEEETRARIVKARGDGSKDKDATARAGVDRLVASLQKEGDGAVAAIRTTYQRANDDALFALTQGNDRLLLQNRSATADLLDDYKERARLQAQIVREEADLEIAELQRVIDHEAATNPERISKLKAQQDAIRDRAAIQAQGINKNAEDPGQRYLRTIHDVNYLNDAIKGIEVQGLDSLNQGIVDAITGTKSLGSAFHDVAGQIIADLLKIGIQRAIINPLADSLFGGATGGGAGGLLGKLFSGLGFAGGGEPPTGVASLVGEEGPELFVPHTSGTIIPNSALRGMNDNGGGGTRVEVVPSKYFDAHVTTLSGQVLAAGAPHVVNAAVGKVFDRISRRGIPAGRG